MRSVSITTEIPDAIPYLGKPAHSKKTCVSWYKPQPTDCRKIIAISVFRLKFDVVSLIPIKVPRGVSQE
jgi:hypothetical protein